MTDAKPHFTRFDLCLLILAALALVAIIYFYPRVFPVATINLELSKTEIETTARKLAREYGYDLKHHTARIQFFQDQNQIEYLTQTYGLSEAYRILSRRTIPAAYWRIQWNVPAQLPSINPNATEAEKLNTQIDNLLHGKLTMNLFPDGSLQSFAINLEDSIRGVSLADSQAFQLAVQFVRQQFRLNLNDFDLRQTTSKKLAHRTDHIFRLHRKQLIHHERIEYVVIVQGNRLGGLEINYLIPENFISPHRQQQELSSVFQMLIFILYLIILAVTLFQKLKNDSLSFQTGFLISLFAALATAITVWSSVDEISVMYRLITLILPPLFTGGAMLMIFTVADATTREVWNEKMATYDAVRKRMLFISPVGIQIWRGLGTGILLLGLNMLLLHFGIDLFHLAFRGKSSQINAITASSPLLYILAEIFIQVAFIEITFRLFTISYLRRYLKSTLLIILIAGLTASMGFGGLIPFITSSELFNFGLKYFLSLFLGYVFIKFDFLTILVTCGVAKLLHESLGLFYYQQPEYSLNGAAGLTLIGLLLVIALIGQLRRKGRYPDLSDFAPPYLARLAERERLKRELEIARQVQMNFLPKTTPRLPGLGVASVCIPATEVGGDYFDFIPLDANRLGVVIGDVSGKGISAAFYMTLLKGLIKSQAQAQLSPREVLIQLNRLFYENVVRGTFVSLIYGIFDIAHHSFTCARAGHNPVLKKSGTDSAVNRILPCGLALGLERGQIFNQTIEEVQSPLQAKDHFIFYTDGFSEAMNQHKEEFGETRMLRWLEQQPVLSAQEVIDGIRHQVGLFVGKTPQHDDMTMVCVRIL